MKTPIFTDAIQDNSLTDLLNEVTQEKPRKEFNLEPGTNAIPDDFDAAAIEQEQHDQEQQQQQIEEANKRPDPPEKKPFMPYNEQAEMLVAAFDSIQQLSLPALAKKTTFSNEEKKALKSVIRKRKIDKTSLTNEEKLLFEKWVLLKEFEDELPFSDKEIKFLVNPLAKLLEQQQAEMKPGQALIVAAATVTLPRVAAFIALRSDMSEIGNSFEKNEQKALENGKSNNSVSGPEK